MKTFLWYGKPYMGFDEGEVVTIATALRSWLETFESEKDYPSVEYVDLWVEIAKVHTVLRNLGVK